MLKNKKKGKKEAVDSIRYDEINSSSKKDTLGVGTRGLKDLLAPSCFDRGHETYIQAGNKFVRNFMLHGYPSVVYVGWLDHLYSYNGDMDVSVHIEPANERQALEQITAKITQYESQYNIEREKGNIRDTTRLRNQIQDLYAQREALERNFESLFYMQISANLFANSVEQLNKETQRLDNALKGRKMNFLPSDLRHDDGYRTALPFGKQYLTDCFRNMTTGSTSSCFPFYNSDIYHESGIWCGVNKKTATMVSIDFYDRSKLYNSNVNVFGQAGAGKSFLVKLLTFRSALRGIKTVIIDPEGEYKKLARALSGSCIELSSESRLYINPLDVEEEDELDADDNPTGRKIVNLRAKVTDVLSLLEVMCEGLNTELRSIMSYALMEVYKDFGFTTDPESLYTLEEVFNTVTSELTHVKKMKTMPTLSDFHNKITQIARAKGNYELQRVANGLTIYLEGGVFDLFDHHTSPELVNFKNSPLVVFDISKIESNALRPIAMFVALSWAWEKFAKKNLHIKKRVICDEAWMLLSKNMIGHEYTSQFLDSCARRIRKRNGGLLVASQNFTEFSNSEQGKAVLTNAITNIFLKQNSTDIDALQDTFKLSDGEKNFLLGASRGEVLIKTAGQTAVADVVAFPFEVDIIAPSNESKQTLSNNELEF